MTLRITGSESAQTAHPGTHYKLMPPKELKRQTPPNHRSNAGVLQHPVFMQHVEQSMFYAMKTARTLLRQTCGQILAENGLAAAVLRPRPDVAPELVEAVW